MKITRKKITESPIKTRVRKMILEGEMENAESALAAKDLVDRLQDTIGELGKMSNDELPHLIDSIRGSFGPEPATAYQNVANSVLSELLDFVKTKKTELENATLTLTGDASAEQTPGTDLDIPDDESMGEEGDSDELKLDQDELDEPSEGPKNPLGRETRMPTEESRNFNKKLTEAKIIALKEALDNTNSKKTPLRAKRLAEELRKIVTSAIKEEAKKLADPKPHEFEPGKTFKKNCAQCLGAFSKPWHQKKTKVNEKYDDNYWNKVSEKEKPMEQFLADNGWSCHSITAPNGRKQLMWKPKGQGNNGVEYNTLNAFHKIKETVTEGTKVKATGKCFGCKAKLNSKVDDGVYYCVTCQKKRHEKGELSEDRMTTPWGKKGYPVLPRMGAKGNKCHICKGTGKEGPWPGGRGEPTYRKCKSCKSTGYLEPGKGYPNGIVPQNKKRTV